MAEFGARGAMGRTVWLSALLPALALGACQFLDLNRDLEKISARAEVYGTIEKPEASDHPVLVVIFRDSLSRKRVLNAKLVENDEFRFSVPGGRYVLFAFEDTNGDLAYQAGEPAAQAGRPEAFALEDGELRSVTLKLHRDGVAIAAAPDDAEAATDEERYPELWSGHKNIGAVVALDDPRFDRAYGQMGLWEPLRFSLEVGPGLYMLEPYDPKRVPVVFIHGLGGTPRDFATLIGQIDRRRYQPWLLAYGSGLRLDLNAGYFFDALTQLRLKHGFQRLYLVAHSMGGLVTQGFLNRHRIKRSGYLKLLVTLATPWGGHEAAQKGVDNAPVVVPAWRDMAPGSAYLEALQASTLPPDLPHHLMFAFGGSSLMTAAANDGTVTVASQLHPNMQLRAERLYGFDASHVGILSDPQAIDQLFDILDQHSTVTR